MSQRTVHGWSAGPGGSEWYRLTLPLSGLSTLHNWTASVSTTYPSTRVLDPPDVVVVQRPMTDVAKRTVRHWHRKSLTAVVVDLDDDMWTIPPDNPAHKLATPELLANLETTLAMADVVTVSTTHLAEVVNRHTRAPIRVVPNCVPESLVEWPRPARHKGSQVTVGWSGSATHLGDWRAEAAGIQAALRYSNKIDVHMVGTDYATAMMRCRRPIRHTPFQRDIMAYYDALDFHISLAPLARTEFNLSKSDLRILEAAAIGAVPVMSEWGPYARVTGRHAKDLTGWRQHVADLVSDPQQLSEEREAWKQWARARTVEANAHRWNDIYEGVLSNATSA